MTPRTPDRPTYGGDVARVAAALGRPLMPHQRLIADIAGEVLPSGRMAYPVVVILMPRRGGKTALLLPTFLQRAAALRRARCWYTAQTGGDAGTTFREEWLPELDELAARRHVTTRLSNGSESFTVRRSAGRVGVFAPTRKALHGQDADVVGIDEAWSFDALTGRQLMQAIRPAMLTRLQRQLYIISAGGDESSEWLLEWRELGRALTGPDQGVAYFEWHPDVVELEGGGFELAPGVDLDDPAVWAATHPAVGHTIDLAALADDRRTFGVDEFRRAYLNVFQTGAADRALPRLAWERNVHDDVAVPAGWGTVVTFDVAPESSSAAVVMTGRGAAGKLCAELVDHGAGNAWVADRVRQLATSTGATIAGDSKGASGVVMAELRRQGVPVVELGAADVATAAEQLLAALLNDTIDIRAESVMSTAAAHASRRRLGDGWAFTRRGSSGDITPVTALSFGVHVAAAAVDGRPLIESAAS